MSTAPDKKIAPMLPQEKRAVGIVASIAMLRTVGLFSLVPVLALYAAQLPGHRPILIGLAVGAYGLTQAGLQIPLGALSDRIGRIPVIVGGLLVFAAGSVVAAVGHTIWAVIAGRFIQGAGAIAATLSALIADSTREAVRTRSMAFYGVGYGLAFLIAFGGGPAVAAQFGVPALFWMAASFALIGLGLLAALPRGGTVPLVPQGWKFAPAFRSNLLRLDAYIFLLHCMLTATFVALPFLVTKKLQLTVGGYGEVVAATMVVSLLGAVPLIISDERQGKAWTISAAVALILAGELILAFLGISIVPVFIALALLFAGVTFLEAGLPARVSVLADNDARGASLGVFSSSQFLGVFAGGLLGGRFLEAGRPADVFFVCALLAGIWLVAGIRFTDS